MTVLGDDLRHLDNGDVGNVGARKVMAFMEERGGLWYFGDRVW